MILRLKNNYRDGYLENIQFILLHPKFPKQVLPKSDAKILKQKNRYLCSIKHKHFQIDRRNLLTQRGLNKNLTGKVPGSDASKKDTKEFGGAAKWTGDPEKSLELEEIWA